MKILLTGATGFVGRHIAKRLIDEGHELTITSSGTGPHPEGVKKILYRGLGGIDWKYVEGQDAVIHQFANNDTRCTDREEMMRANVNGPFKLFYRAYFGGCKRFIYASSTAVYGAEPAPYVEGVTPINPLNVYGHSKARFDEIMEEFCENDDVHVTGLRYCNVYGPGEHHKGKRKSMIGQLLRQMLKFKKPVIFKDGEQKRDWIYVKDVVEMNMLALKASDKPGLNIYNCGSGVATSFNEIIKTINEALSAKNLALPVDPEYIDCPFASEYQNFTQCSIEKARRELLFEPSYDLRSGIDEYLKDLTSAS